MSHRSDPDSGADRLTRALLERNGLAELIAKDAPGLALLTEPELEQSRRQVLVQRPTGPVWLFAYGSLLWNPTVHAVETRRVRMRGWRRALSVSVTAGRGSEAEPGLVLGLEPGEGCEGLAMRLDETTLDQDLRLLWRREMITGAYTPHWLHVEEMSGEPLGLALTFTTNPASPHYAGLLDEIAILGRLARAKGSLGSSAEYVLRTCEALEELCLDDRDLRALKLKIASAKSR